MEIGNANGKCKWTMESGRWKTRSAGKLSMGLCVRVRRRGCRAVSNPSILRLQLQRERRAKWNYDMYPIRGCVEA